MPAIVNKPKITNDALTDKLRAAIGHRATWMGLLLKEAKDRGLDWEATGHAAVLATGHLHGDAIKGRCSQTDSLVDFSKNFITEDVKKIFEVDIKKCDESEFSIEFNYCPLVAGWTQAGIPNEMMPKLCDIAMSGDRGICDQFHGFEFHLGKTIAEGNNVCEVKFTRKQK